MMYSSDRRILSEKLSKVQYGLNIVTGNNTHAKA